MFNTCVFTQSNLDQIIHKTVHTKTVCGSGEPSSGSPYIKLTVKAKRLERLYLHITKSMLLNVCDVSIKH